MASQAFLEKAYLAYFGRPVDPSGAFAYANTSEATVLTSFSSSAESVSLYGSTFGYAQINAIYQMLFNRDADIPGANFYLARVGNGTSTVAGVALDILNGAQNTDVTVINNKITASRAFTASLDTIPELVGYQGNAAAAAARDYLKTVTTTAATQAAIDAAVASAVSVGGVSGSTFTLTTGAETIPGTSGNDTFVGAINAGTATTFGVGDILNGGAGVDTLILNDGQSVAGTVTLTMPAGASLTNIEKLVVNGGAGLVADSTGAAYSGVTDITVNNAGIETLTLAAGQSLTSTTTAGAATINGGLNITAKSTQADGAQTTTSVGATTRAAGTVNLTSTQTYATAGNKVGNVTAKGTTGVTINTTVNDLLALAVNAANEPNVADTAGLITADSTSGNVVVNSALNVTALTTIGGGTIADAIAVTGGTSVTVNETVTAIQTATTVSAVTEGAVTVTGGANTTDVTVNQAPVATGKIVTTAVAAIPGTTGVAAVVAAPGKNAVAAATYAATTAATAAVATGTATITADGAVTIADKNAASATATNTIATVTLNSYGNSTISSSALTTLNLAGTGGTLSLTNNNTVQQNAAANALALNVNGLSYTGAGATSNAITDASNVIKTLNITTGATASSILGAATYSTTAFTGTALTAVNVSGSSVLTMGAWGTAPATITVTGAAGYTGIITDTTTTFTATGSTGRDIIGIGASPTKVITAGSATNNELVINAANVADTGTTAANFTKLNTNTSGFTVLGVTNALAGLTVDMSKLSSSFNSIDILNTAAWGGGNPAVTFTKVVAGTGLSLNAANSSTITYGTADTNGANDAVTVTINGGTAGFTTSALAFADANGVGLGTVNIVSNASTYSTGANTITTLTDTGVTALNVSGTGGLVVTTFADGTTSLVINNTSTNVPAAVAAPTAGYSPVYVGSATVTALTDNSLGNLSFTGSGLTVITTLNDTAANITINSTDSSLVQIGTLAGTGGANNLTFTGTGTVDVGVLTTTAAAITLTNSGTGTVIVGDRATAGVVDANLATLTLNGNVQFGTDSLTAMTVTGVTTSFTIAAGTDHAHLNIHTGATANGSTLTATLGNGNNLLTSDSIAGQLTVTVGTGSNLINLAAGVGATTYLANVTLGAHTPTSTLFDQVNVITNSTAVANTIITGAVAGDKIGIADATLVTTLTSAQLATVAAAANLAAAVALVDSATYLGATTHNAAAFVWGGNTYVFESALGGTADAGTTVAGNTLIELIGTHTITAGTVAGVIAIAS